MREREANPADHPALVSGPTNAIQNSTFAAGGILLDLGDAAQSKQRDFLHGQLLAVATRECASSCSSSETKNRSAGGDRTGQDDAVAPIGIARMELRRK